MAKAFPWPQDLSPQTDQMYRSLKAGDDLACAVIGASFVDHCLASILQSYLAKGETAIELLQPGKPLGEFSARGRLCYALGLIAKDTFLELESIGTIRNKFAHKLFSAKFSDADVSALCAKLHGHSLIPFSEKRMKKITARERFEIATAMLAGTLLLIAKSTKHREPKDGAKNTVPGNDNK